MSSWAKDPRRARRGLPIGSITDCPDGNHHLGVRFRVRVWFGVRFRVRVWFGVRFRVRVWFGARFRVRDRAWLGVRVSVRDGVRFAGVCPWEA